jgi:hypothetical protein
VTDIESTVNASATRVLTAFQERYGSAAQEGKLLALIRSQTLIGLLHQYVIDELERNGVRAGSIYENKAIYGYPKIKEQDVLVQRPQDGPNVTTTGPQLVVNIRSQLSSVANNYDTLFERLIAEATNLHNRFPYLVAGYLYLIPVRGYDSGELKEGRLVANEDFNLDKYLVSFDSINSRTSPADQSWKFERVCLLIADFGQTPPVIINDPNDLVKAGRIHPETLETVDYSRLRIGGFFRDLLLEARRRSPLIPVTS